VTKYQSVFKNRTPANAPSAAENKWHSTSDTEVGRYP